jgi:DNA-binding GntR family transcriptional regulator
MGDLSHTSTDPAADAVAADRSHAGLANQIYHLIAAGDIGLRARLASERTPAERFGVSRTQVREALIALEVQGARSVSGRASMRPKHRRRGRPCLNCRAGWVRSRCCVHGR